jgi:hypothetical protein
MIVDLAACYSIRGGFLMICLFGLCALAIRLGPVWTAPITQDMSPLALCQFDRAERFTRLPLEYAPDPNLDPFDARPSSSGSAVTSGTTILAAAFTAATFRFLLFASAAFFALRASLIC